MKQVLQFENTRKLILCLIFLSLGMLAKAEVIPGSYSNTYTDGNNVVWYFNVVNGKAEIVAWNSDNSTGDLVIPKQVYDNAYYDVSSVSVSGMASGTVSNSFISNLSFESGCQASIPSRFLESNAFLQSIDFTHYAGSSIPTYAFYQCSSLTSVIFPTACRKIEASAFSGCSSLQSINLSNTQVHTIDTKAFEGCYGATSVSFPSTLTTLGTGAFWSASQLSEVDFSNTNITGIPQECLRECRSLTTVKFSPQLTEVLGSAFRNCTALKELTFPASLQSLNDNIFQGSTSMQKVIFEGTTPPTFKTNMFQGAPATMKICVPVDCSAAYKTKLTAVGAVVGTAPIAANNVREQVTISRYGFSTYFLANENFKVPTGMTVYVVTGSQQLAGGKRHAVIETFNAGTVPPKGQGCILQGTPSTTYEYEAAVSTAEQSLQHPNLMKGTAAAAGETFAGGDGMYYVLSPDPNDPSLIGFYYQNGTAGNSMTLKAHQAGLFLPTGTVAPSKKFLYEQGNTTGIHPDMFADKQTSKIHYDLQGRRIQRPTRGLYIVNGEKIMVK